MNKLAVLIAIIVCNTIHAAVNPPAHPSLSTHHPQPNLYLNELNIINGSTHDGLKYHFDEYPDKHFSAGEVIKFAAHDKGAQITTSLSDQTGLLRKDMVAALVPNCPTMEIHFSSITIRRAPGHERKPTGLYVFINNHAEIKEGNSLAWVSFNFQPILAAVGSVEDTRKLFDAMIEVASKNKESLDAAAQKKKAKDAKKIRLESVGLDLHFSANSTEITIPRVWFSFDDPETDWHFKFAFTHETLQKEKFFGEELFADGVGEKVGYPALYQRECVS